MVAYSFRQQFVEPILSGAKQQTIRAPRNGRSQHAKPGQALQLYTAMRTKYCTLIGTATCERALPVSLEFRENWITIDGKFFDGSLDDFAVRDGFANWQEMQGFWHRTGISFFDGIMIRWLHFQPRMTMLKHSMSEEPNDL